MPILAFVLVRLVMGGRALEVGYGYDAGAGQLPGDYAARLLDGTLLFDVLLRTVCGLGALWWGVVQARRDPAALVYVVLVVLAAWLLSSRIARVVGILYVVAIPGVLAWCERGHQWNRNQSR